MGFVPYHAYTTNTFGSFDHERRATREIARLGDVYVSAEPCVVLGGACMNSTTCLRISILNFFGDALGLSGLW